MTSDAIAAPSGTFDEVVLPHLGEARRLARWLVRNEHDAEDIVQDATLRAFRYFGTFAGGNGRAWFLRIVRNSCYGTHKQLAAAGTDLFDEERHSSARTPPDPEAVLIRLDGTARLAGAMAVLPKRSRDLLVLRELEGLSYQELAEELQIPVGTVMSALWRARRALRGELERTTAH